MKITLKLLVTFEKFLPPGSEKNMCEILIPSGSSVGEGLNMYNVPIEEAVVLVNGKSPKKDYILLEGDTLCAFPAAVGG